MSFADFAVGTKFTASNKMGTVYKSMSKSTNKFADNTERMFGKASKSASNFGAVVKGIITTDVLRRGTMLLQRGLQETGQEFVSFDDALTQASAKFPEKIGRGTDAFFELSNAARTAGKETQFTAAEAAQGLDFMAMAGFTASQAIASLPGIVDLATAANIELARSSDIATDALGAFGLMVDSPEQLAVNLQRVNDVFARTVTTSNTTMENLFDTMSESGPALKTTGAEIETFAALAGKLGSAGIKGSKAGTNLKNIFLRLASPVGKAKTLIKKIGLETQDSAGNMRDMIDIIRDLNVKTKDMGTAQRAAALDTIFGKRAISGISVLLDEGADKLTVYRDQILNAKGASQEMAGEMRKSLLNRLKTLRSSLIEVGFKVVDAFAGKAPGIIDAFIKKVNEFDPQPIVDGLIKFGKFVGDVVGKVWKFREAIAATAGAFAGFSFLKSIIPLLPVLVSGVAALTSPLGAAALGFAAVTALAIRFREELTPIGETIQSVIVPAFNDVKTALGSMANMFVNADGSASPLIGTIATLVGGFLKFTGTLAIGPLRAWAKWANINAKILGFVFRAVSFVANSIKGFLQPALDAISQRFGILKNRILNFLAPLKTVTGVIGDFFGQIDSLISDPKASAKRAQGREGDPFQAPADFRQQQLQGVAPADFRAQAAAGIGAPLPTGFEETALDRFDKLSIDDLAGDNFRFQQPDILPGVDMDTDKLINGLADAVAKQPQDIKVEVQVNSPTPGTTATASVTSAPSVNAAQLGATS